MGDYPTGTVTFLFTDVVGSSRLWTEDEQAMSKSLRLHDDVVRETIERHGGYVFTTAGDAFCAAFEEGADGARAAVGIHRALARVEWPGPPLHVRIGLHAGPAELRAGDYFGSTVNAASRIAAAAHAGQTIMSAAVEARSAGFTVLDLGEHQLSDLSTTVHVLQLDAGEFPAVQTGEVRERFAFDGFTVDVAARELRSAGELVHLEPQVFDVLACLLRHRDRLVSREDLLEEVWGDQFVSLSALNTRIKSVRQALGDDGRTQRYVRTEHGRGYRFVGEVEIDPGRSGGDWRPAVAASTSLPDTLDPILGREAEADDLGRSIEEARLVTVIGPGGMGKTRLSIEVARHWAAASPSRTASFVPLDQVRVADDLAAAVATSLGIDASSGPDPATACADWLATGERLVVLDNCEHLLAPVAELTSTLLAGGGSAVILATSREPLRLPEEHRYRLTPLPVPSLDDLDASRLGPCIQLFSDRARRVDADFSITPDNAALVVGLCSRLDGLPLAVELAASRLGSLGLVELAETLSHRLDAIYGSRQDGDLRHQNLRSTVDWSYRLLPDRARLLFDAMSRFPGGLRLGDVIALAERLEIGADADVLLSQLVDASMLYAVEGPQGRRYRMLETLRHFGSDQVQQDAEFSASVDRALVDHAQVLAVAERESWTVPSARGRFSLGLRDEIPNIRAARVVMFEHGELAGLAAMSVDLALFTEQACLGELWAWHDEIVERRSDLDGDARVDVDLLAAAADRNAGRLDSVFARAEAVIEASSSPWTEGLAWHQTAMSRLYAGELVGAVEAWDNFDELTGLCVGRIFGAMCLGYAGRLNEAEDRLDRCHPVLDGGHPYMVAGYHYVAGELSRLAGSPTARQSFERGVMTCLEHDLRFTLGICRVSLASLLAAEGDDRAAAVTFVELIEQWLRSGAWPQLWITLRNAGELLAEVDPATALLIWAAADTDPQATAMDADAAEHLDELKETCRERCGRNEAVLIEKSARRTSKSDIVSRALVALKAIG